LDSPESVIPDLLLPQPKYLDAPENLDESTGNYLLTLIKQPLFPEAVDSRRASDMLSLSVNALSGRIMNYLNNSHKISNKSDWLDAVRKPFLDEKLGILAEYWGLPFPNEQSVVLTHDVDDINFYSIRERFRKLLFMRPVSIKNLIYQGLQILYTPVKALRDPAKNHFIYNLVKFNRDNGLVSSYFIPVFFGRGHRDDPFHKPTDRIPVLNKTVKEFFNSARDTENLEVCIHPGIWISDQNKELYVKCAKSFFNIYSNGRPFCRQHFLYLNPLTLENWDGAGFQLDSTFGFNHITGYAAGVSRPFYLWDKKAQRSSKILELPFAIQDVPLFKNKLTAPFPTVKPEIDHYLDMLMKFGGFLVVIFHPTYQSVSFPAFRKAYKYFIDRVRSNNLKFLKISQISDSLQPEKLV
jgi:hypothetical protein